LLKYWPKGQNGIKNKNERSKKYKKKRQTTEKKQKKIEKKIKKGRKAKTTFNLSPNIGVLF